EAIQTQHKHNYINTHVNAHVGHVVPAHDQQSSDSAKLASRLTQQLGGDRRPASGQISEHQQEDPGSPAAVQSSGMIDARLSAVLKSKTLAVHRRRSLIAATSRHCSLRSQDVVELDVGRSPAGQDDNTVQQGGFGGVGRQITDVNNWRLVQIGCENRRKLWLTGCYGNSFCCYAGRLAAAAADWYGSEKWKVARGSATEDLEVLGGERAQQAGHMEVAQRSTQIWKVPSKLRMATATAEKWPSNWGSERLAQQLGIWEAGPATEDLEDLEVAQQLQDLGSGQQLRILEVAQATEGSGSGPATEDLELAQQLRIWKGNFWKWPQQLRIWKWQLEVAQQLRIWNSRLSLSAVSGLCFSAILSCSSTTAVTVPRSSRLARDSVQVRWKVRMQATKQSLKTFGSVSSSGGNSARALEKALEVSHHELLLAAVRISLAAVEAAQNPKQNFGQSHGSRGHRHWRSASRPGGVSAANSDIKVAGSAGAKPASAAEDEPDEGVELDWRLSAVLLWLDEPEFDAAHQRRADAVDFALVSLINGDEGFALLRPEEQAEQEVKLRLQTRKCGLLQCGLGAGQHVSNDADSSDDYSNIGAVQLDELNQIGQLNRIQHKILPARIARTTSPSLRVINKMLTTLRMHCSLIRYHENRPRLEPTDATACWAAVAPEPAESSASETKIGKLEQPTIVVNSAKPGAIARGAVEESVAHEAGENPHQLLLQPRLIIQTALKVDVRLGRAKCTECSGRCVDGKADAYFGKSSVRLSSDFCAGLHLVLEPRHTDGTGPTNSGGVVVMEAFSKVSRHPYNFGFNNSFSRSSKSRRKGVAFTDKVLRIFNIGEAEWVFLIADFPLEAAMRGKTAIAMVTAKELAEYFECKICSNLLRKTHLCSSCSQPLCRRCFAVNDSLHDHEATNRVLFNCLKKQQTTSRIERPCFLLLAHTDNAKQRASADGLAEEISKLLAKCHSALPLTRSVRNHCSDHSDFEASSESSCVLFRNLQGLSMKEFKMHSRLHRARLILITMALPGGYALTEGAALYRLRALQNSELDKVDAERLGRLVQGNVLSV
uniref:B box-type domain-containing protein n=1 Tax=Macrostomum lignano TaxID=282301 RepID=A0A1I8IA25_9PLAT